MHALPPGMAAAVAAGATTFCRCWRLLRRDGLVLGFTDHDRDLTVDGTTHSARSGLEGSAGESPLGLSIGGGEVNGALTSDAISEPDIAAGLWDGAGVELRLVDWSNPEEWLLLETGTIGEIRRTDHGFVVELRGPAQALDQPRGRLFQAACSADLGDARCRVDLLLPQWHGTGAVSGGDGRLVFESNGIADFADGLFTGGTLTFTSGRNVGAVHQVKRHWVAGGAVRLALWAPSVAPVMAGDAFSVVAGCDKRFATCRDLFANTLNFRGFANMPGNDFTLGYIRTGEPGLDGRSLLP